MKKYLNFESLKLPQNERILHFLGKNHHVSRKFWVLRVWNHPEYDFLFDMNGRKCQSLGERKSKIMFTYDFFWSFWFFEVKPKYENFLDF